MRYLTTSKESKAVDTYTIERTGIPSLVLMERASLSVANHVAEVMAALPLPIEQIRIASVCGSGNNGGDGIAAARILHSRGMDVTVIMIGDELKLSDDCRKQLEIAKNLGMRIVNEANLCAYNIIIDAIFGIGLVRDITGHYAAWIEAMNQARKNGSQIIAVDIPSGISTDTGKVMGTAVFADYTVTFGYLKLGLVLYPGTTYAGRVFCEDIGFDPAVESAFCHIGYTEDDLLMLPKRVADSNKGTYGRVLVIAGSKNMSGASYFSACAAYKLGCGLVTIYTPESNRTIIQTLLPEAVLKTYADNQFDDVSLREAMAMNQIVVLGPGLGINQTSEALVQYTLENIQDNTPLIIDADALNILSHHLEWLKNCKAQVIITPHLKELSRLTNQDIVFLKENLISVSQSFARENEVVCVAKDARTVVVNQSEQVYINLSGNNGMSTGGSGDVLTGVIAGLLSQKLGVADAAKLGVYIHGLLGDFARNQFGVHAMLASNLLDMIPVLMQQIEMKQS